MLARGDYRNQTEKVSPACPSMLPPLPGRRRLNRLTLARWLVDPKHPLTARVAVNRFWQTYFGIGIVKTQEDFGVQGDAAVASRAARLAGDRIHQHRLGHPRDAAADRDVGDLPAVVGGHGRVARSRPREPAAGARPALPAAGGTGARHRAGGERPAQDGDRRPERAALSAERALGRDGLRRRVLGAVCEQSHGRDLYRRGMYTFWKRTVPPASLATFDAPDREKCTARRARTNTPLQALVLMNDPTYVEAARALAQRALRRGREGRPSAHRATPSASRPRASRPRSRACCARCCEHRLDGIPQGSARRRGEAGRRRIAARYPHLDAAELAAWTTVASAILNLDETITKQ